MNWTITNIEEPDFIRVKLEEDFSVGAVRQTLAELFKKDFWEPGKPLLFDVTELDMSNTDLDEIREGSQVYFENAANYGGSKLAVLSGSLADFARGRQFELLTNNNVKANIRIFLKEDEAVDWLLSES